MSNENTEAKPTAEEAGRVDPVVMRILHSKQHSDVPELRIELFEMLDGSYPPFRCRLVDKATGEVGPQIKMFNAISKAAKCYEEEWLIW